MDSIQYIHKHTRRALGAKGRNNTHNQLAGLQLVEYVIHFSLRAIVWFVYCLILLLYDAKDYLLVVLAARLVMRLFDN